MAKARERRSVRGDCPRGGLCNAKDGRVHACRCCMLETGVPPPEDDPLRNDDVRGKSRDPQGHGGRKKRRKGAHGKRETKEGLEQAGMRHPCDVVEREASELEASWPQASSLFVHSCLAGTGDISLMIGCG